MLGKDHLLSLAERALQAVEADQAQVLIWAGRSALTRFAESRIHQNVAETDTTIQVQAVIGQQLAVASTNRVDDAGLKEVAAQASRMARNSAANPDFRSLPSPQPIEPVHATADATAASTPEERAEAAQQIIAEAKKVGAVASGSISVSDAEFAVANSLGVRAHQASTRAGASTLIADSEGDSSGWGEWSGMDIGQFRPREIGERAARKCAESRGAGKLDPGAYTVILEEPAAAEMVEFLSWLGFGATAYQEGRSFMCGQIGKQIVGANITVLDDPRNPRGFPSAFDYEGMPRQTVVLIENGIARNVVYDTFTATKEGKQTTGNALPPSAGFHPMPMNVVVSPGDASVEQMIASTERGLLVTRFHYTNVISPRETIITGMTRDGTFLIENGVVVRPVQKLRFTQNVLTALSKVTMLGKTQTLTGGTLVPAMKIEGFTFTS